MSDTSPFAPPGTSADLEEGAALTPKFDADGLVTCVATDAASGDVLMVAHMNAEALAKTIATGEAWYFSRSRRALWKKGETSGHTQRVVEMRIDCDQDAVWIKVEQIAGACHTGRRSCFYRAVPLGKVRRGDARIPRRARVRSEDGVSDQRLISFSWRGLRQQPLARARCGRSYITPPMPTTPAPGFCANASTIGLRLRERRLRSA